MARERNWFQWEKDLLIEKFADNSNAVLDQLLNRKVGAISSMGTKLKLQKTELWTKEQIELLYQNYETGDIEWLSKTLGKKIHAISEYARKRKLVRKININRNGTLEPLLSGSHEAFYWLGMYAADGYIAKNGHFMLSQSEKDKDQVYKLANFLQTDVYFIPIEKMGNTSYANKKSAYRVNVCDKDIGIRIREMFGVQDEMSKTYTGISLDFMNIGDDRNVSFLIGLIDGDGYIAKNGCTRVECHLSWSNTFERLIKRLPLEHQSIKIRVTNHKKDDIVKYYVAMYINKINTIKLYRHALKYNLPISKRKWVSVENWLFKQQKK